MAQETSFWRLSMSARAISLILATYGRTDDVGRLIDSLRVQTSRDFELIVVDQNVDNRLQPYVDMARAAHIATRHLRLDVPNLSGARNAGLAAAEGEWVAFPDDDCWYEPETLDHVMKAARPDLGGIVIQWPEYATAEMQSVSRESVLSLRAWRNLRGGEASSICLFVRRELALRLQGFDVRLGVGQWFGSAEETDFVLRALASGAVIERVDQARVHHAYGGRRAVVPLRVVWRTVVCRARGTGALYAKHGLPSWVIIRGLLAPLPLALIRWHGMAGLVRASALVWGRTCGILSWHQRNRQ